MAPMPHINHSGLFPHFDGTQFSFASVARFETIHLLLALKQDREVSLDKMVHLCTYAFSSDLMF
jgi:hypothetical protein